MSGRVLLLVLFPLLLLQSRAGAQPIGGIPNLFLSDPSLTLQQNVLGHSCYSMRSSESSIDCNPAFMADQERQTFRLSLVGNDRISDLNSYRIQLNRKDQIGVAEELLSERSQVVARATSAVWFQNDWWAVGYVPFRGGLAYVSRNPAYPSISVQAFRESEVFAQAGLFLSDDQHFRFGLRSRYVNREYIYQSFDVFDAAANPRLVAFQHQEAIYFEPSAAYNFDSSWEPILTASVSNIPAWQGGRRLPIEPVYDLGFSSRLFDVPGLRSGTNYSYSPESPDFFSRFAWSMIYDVNRWCALDLTLGSAKLGVGVNGKWSFLNAGVAFTREKLWIDPWIAKDVSTWTFELGLNF